MRKKIKKILSNNIDAAALDEPEAFLAILYCVIAADGKITEEENRDVMSIVRRTNIMSSFRIYRWQAAAVKIHRKIDQDGLYAVVRQAAKFISPENRKGVYCYACDMMYADGEVSEVEPDLLHFIAKELEIDEEYAHRVYEIFAVKNSL